MHAMRAFTTADGCSMHIKIIIASLGDLFWSYREQLVITNNNENGPNVSVLVLNSQLADLPAISPDQNVLGLHHNFGPKMRGK